MPYWGDSIVANAIDYRKDTPLQCTLDGATGAQAIIFGMFGVRVDPDGKITVRPQPPPFARRIARKGLRIGGRTLDIVVSGRGYGVVSDGRTWRARIGKTVVVERPARGD